MKSGSYAFRVVDFNNNFIVNDRLGLDLGIYNLFDKKYYELLCDQFRSPHIWKWDENSSWSLRNKIKNGLDENSTIFLTKAMRDSGTVLAWPKDWSHLVVDKHSTGGVGDKVSIILAPALAACGLKVPMISGRGLGHTGGTQDKLSSIPGYEVEQSEASFQKIVSEIGCAIVGQTSDLVPADKILYSTRDVTSTVDSVDLITASIISKKLASGINNLILDVKVGRGALMTNIRQAKKLAKSLVSVSNASNCKTRALITSMDDPLSSSIGNSLEVETVVEILLGKNKNEQALLDLSLIHI